MGEQNLAVGVDRRPGEATAQPSAHSLAYWPEQPLPVATEDGSVVFRMALGRDDVLRALVDIPLSALTVSGHLDDHVRRVVGSVAARQLTRLAARGRLPTQAPLMPLRLVGLDPHVARLLCQGQLALEPGDRWTVLA